MKKYLLVLCVVLATLAGAVLSAQAGNFCNVDNYGCTVELDGEQIYIMFWSEEARKTIMGPLSDPYTLVTDFCAECVKDGKFELAPRVVAERRLGFWEWCNKTGRTLQWIDEDGVMWCGVPKTEDEK